MIKIFIFVTAFSFISQWGSDECVNRPLTPQVKFFLSEKDAARAYTDSINEKKRLFVIKLAPWDKTIDVRELNVLPATSYEIIVSSHIIAWEKEPAK